MDMICGKAMDQKAKKGDRKIFKSPSGVKTVRRFLNLNLSLQKTCCIWFDIGDSELFIFLWKN